MGIRVARFFRLSNARMMLVLGRSRYGKAAGAADFAEVAKILIAKSQAIRRPSFKFEGISKLSFDAPDALFG